MFTIIPIEAIFYLNLFIMLIFATFYDIKYKKIPNFVIFGGIFASLILNVFIIILSLSHVISIKTSDLWKFYFEYFISWFQMSIILFFLWSLKMISAGDAKLLIATYSLMPPTIFHFNHVKNLYHIIHFQNLLLIVLIVFMKDLTKVKLTKTIKTRLKGIFHPKFVFSVILFVYGLTFLMRLVFMIFKVQFNNLFLSIIVLFIFWKLLSIIFAKKTKYAMLFLVVLRLILEHNHLLSLSYWSNTLILTVVILLIRFILIYVAYEVFTKEVKIENLKPGMKLAERIKLKKTGKQWHFIKTEYYKLTLISTMDEEFDKGIKRFEREFKYDPKIGLTEYTIKKLIKLKQEGKLHYDSIRVFESFALAPYILVATLLTIIFRGDIITAILVYILKH